MDTDFQNIRQKHELPESIENWGWKYHHLGIPTDKKMPDERYIPKYKFYVSGFDTNPFGIEWMRFEDDCPFDDLIKSVPHLAFVVQDLDFELANRKFKMIVEPNSPSEGVRVAMIEYKNAPIELMEFENEKKKILIPLPSYGFDPTEAAIPWKIFSRNHLQITFATPSGQKADGDKIMITGKGLGIFKQLLKARKDAVDAYREMYESEEFNNPIKYEHINEHEFDGLYLPGGHDKGVKEYLESEILQNIIPRFFNNNKKVGAICHGVILLARSINPETNKPVIYDYNTTSLLKSQELLAYNLTKLWLNDYYLTYPGLTVEEEVISALKSKKQFIHGPRPVFRDSLKNLKHGFALRDKNYLSARWPGDVYNLALTYIKMLNEQSNRK